MRPSITVEYVKAARAVVVMALLVLAPATVHAQNINLAWDPSVTPEVVGYTVDVGLSPGTPGQTFDVGPATTFTFTQAVPGTRYYFSVRSYDGENRSSLPSNTVSWKINVGPQLTEPASIATRVGVATSLQLAAVDDGDPLTYTASGLPAGLSLNTSTGRITGTPTAVGSRSVSITVSDGQLSATHAFTWNVAPPPTADSVTPATGTGMNGTFQLNYSDPLGAASTSQLWAWFNASFASTSANSCLVHYDVPSARLNLINDAGTAWSQAALGTSGTLQNSQCAIALAGSSVSLSGDSAVLTLSMSFRSGFGGAKNVYMYAAAESSNSGWQTRGAWTVPTTVAAVGADTVSPASGTGSTQSFALQYSDTLGATDLSTAWVWFNSSLASTSANSCLAYYDRAASRVYLINDSGTAWVNGVAGTNATLQNRQCTIALGSTSASLSGNTLTLNLAVTFGGSFSGTKNIYMYAASVGGRNSGWQTRGTWTVPAATLAVSADAVSPATGSGSTQTFSLQYSDTLGATDLATTWVWFNATLASSSANSCLVHYNRSTARLHLINDAGSTWLQGTPGTSGTLQNSQCAIALGSTSASLSGNTLTLNLAVTFRPSYAGGKNIYMYAANGANVNSGWQTRGTWTVPAGGSVGVTADAVSPDTGAGVTETFVLQYSDSTGGANLRTVWAWFNPTLASSSAGSCLVHYDRAWARLYLINDAGTAWHMGALGSGTLQNSQCAIDSSASSTSVSGNTVTLNLRVTFRPAFAGAKNIYMYAASTDGRNSGWQTRGSWTVQ